MPVEDVFFIAGRGAVVTGKIEFGSVRVGDQVEIVGLGETLRTRVTGVEMFRKILNEGRAGDNVGIMLSGVTRRQLQRGQVLARPGSIDTCEVFDAMVTPLPRGRSGRADFYFRTVDLGGRIDFVRGGTASGGKAPARVTLSGLIALRPGDGFAVREGGRTLASGTATRCLSGQGGGELLPANRAIETVDAGAVGTGDRVAKIVTDLLGVDARRVTPSARFREDLGADSLDFVELVMAWEEEFGIEISDSAAARIGTVGDAEKEVKAALFRPAG